MSGEDLPLTPADRIIAELQLASRRSVANRFALIASIAVGLFLLQMVASSATRHFRTLPVVIGVGIAVVIAIGLLVWYFGYRLVSRMAQDLEAGRKQRLTGRLEAITSVGNAYGETVTTITLRGEQFITRGKFFDACRGGEDVVVEILPLSRVALSGSVVEPG